MVKCHAKKTLKNRAKRGKLRPKNDMTRIKNRLEKLEAQQQGENITPLFVATETTPGRYTLDDGRELSQTELDALPSSGPGLHGLVILLPEADRET